MDIEIRNDTRRDDQLVAIDSLRSSIEQEHRFKTSFRGYNKQAVQAYLQELTGEFKAALEQQKAEIDELCAQNAELQTLVESQREKLENLRTEERRKLQLEYDMQEGLVERLREKNSKLLSENQSRQVEIAALQEQLSGFRAIAAERSRQMDALGDKLEALLSAKLRECGDVIAVWKAEFDGVVESESKQVAEP